MCYKRGMYNGWVILVNVINLFTLISNCIIALFTNSEGFSNGCNLYKYKGDTIEIKKWFGNAIYKSCFKNSVL